MSKYFELLNLIEPDKINKLSVSFSGGRTSGMMAFLMKKWAEKYNKEIVFTFANTGLEHEGTYKFVNDCDKAWGLNVYWLEAIINPEKGKGVRAKVTNYNEAVRDGKLFEEMVKKHGLPTRATPHCTTYLKVYVMQSFLRSINFLPSNYHTAIGIRFDELDRINSNYEKNKLLYPLATLKITQKDVDDFWLEQDFKLEIPEHHGNCVTCWKKSDRKLFEISKKSPSSFDFFKKLDSLYNDTNTFGKGKRTMYRSGRSTIDLLNAANDYYSNLSLSENLELDFAGSCSESCEVYNEDDENFRLSTIGDL